MLCVIFKVRQSANTAPAVGVAVIIYLCAFLSSDMAVMQLVSAISVFATIAPTMRNVRRYGERR